MLEQRDIETAVVKWKREGAADLERYFVALAGACGQVAGRLDKWFAEVDARYCTATGCSQVARRPADAGADVQNGAVRFNIRQSGKFGGRRQPARVKLVEGAEELGCQLLVLCPRARSAAFSRSVRPIER